MIARPPFPEILPANVSQALQRASQTPITTSDPMARSRAIEDVLRRARIQHPECFRDDTED